MKRPHLLVIILSLASLSSWSSTLNSKPHVSARCQDLLLELQASLAELGFSSPDDVFLNLAPEEPSITLTSTSKDSHGQTLNHFKKSSEQWLSQSRSNPYDPQGDPRWFIEILGHQASKKLGFALNPPHEITLPSLEAFTFHLARLNEEMKLLPNPDQMEISFYAQTRKSLNNYLENYIEQGRLPLATENLNHYLHDLNFHSAYLFVPKEVSDYSRELNKYTLQRHQSMIEQLDLDLELKKRILYLARLELVEALDHTTASYSVAMNRYNTQAKGEKNPKVFKSALLMSTGESGDSTSSPVDYSVRAFKAAMLKLTIELRNQLKNKEKLYPLLQTLAKVEAESIALLKTPSAYTPSFFQGFQSNRPSGLDFEALCKALTQKRLNAIQAARSLN